MPNLRNFIVGLFLSFGAPWLFLVVVPSIQANLAKPLSYDKDKDGMTGIYPDAPVYRQGQLVYAAEGCVQCHTQVIRPGVAGIIDPWKKGWGSDQSKTPAETRANNFRDFTGEPYAYLGVQRIGPDLANVGYRLEGHSDAEIHAHLYEPRAFAVWSVMPSFRDLYIVRHIQGNGSPRALKLPAGFGPAEGFEIVPTADADELVRYLRSLKKDAPVPGEAVAESGSKK